MKTNQRVQHCLNLLKFSIMMLMLSPMVVMAQTYTLSSGSSINVLGTSNVHDWTMTSSSAESQSTFKFNGRNELIGLTNFSFSVLAKSLKSGKSSMDERTYKSLKSNDFPKISYTLKSAVVTMQGEKYSIATIGSLTIAGSTQPISMTVIAVINPNNTITFHGSEKLKLTDHKIDPPSFMLGAMKVGNDLVIQFDLTYSK